MRTASILLALVVVLGLARQAGAWGGVDVDHNFTISVAGQQFGFCDGKDWDTDSEFAWSRIYLGPLGYFSSPCTAAQGLVGFCVILALSIIVPAVLAVRWKRKRTT